MKKLMLFLCFLLTSISAAQADIVNVLLFSPNIGYSGTEANESQCQVFAHSKNLSQKDKKILLDIVYKKKEGLKTINGALIEKHFNSAFKVVAFEDKMFFILSNPSLIESYCNDNEVKSALADTIELLNKR